MDNKTLKQTAAIFKALSNENRLKIFMLIRAGHDESISCRTVEPSDDIPAHAVCVCEILEQLDVTAPTLSHHLKELRFVGLVDVHHRGQWSYYVVVDNALDDVERFFVAMKPGVMA